MQATPGSFNQQALQLLDQNLTNQSHIYFCGTPLSTFQLAFENNGMAFVAIKNTTIPGNFVPATLEALEQFQIMRVISSIRMKIEMAVIRHQEALRNRMPLTQIASHPAALQQISKWKNNHPGITEIFIPEGTGEAARKLSFGELPVDVGVIGPKNLMSLYSNLAVIEEKIQDSEDNYTTFVLVELVKRSQLATQEEICEEINKLLDEKVLKQFARFRLE